jgi:hypothetical protein
MEFCIADNGQPDARLAVRHILPNLLSPVVVKTKVPGRTGPVPRFRLDK